MATRPVTHSEISRLSTQSCSADRWETVFITEGSDLTRVRNVRFSGTVRLGSTGGSIAYHGVHLPCGVYNSTLTDCDVADGVRIAGVRTGMARYSVEEGVLIEDVGFLATEPGSSFGNGTELEVVNEGGGRRTTIFNRLTSQVAYLQAMFRHNPVFGEKLQDTIRAEIAASTPPQGVIRPASSHWPPTQQEHRAILDACERGDAEQAAALVHVHVAQVGRAIIE